MLRLSEGRHPGTGLPLPPRTVPMPAMATRTLGGDPVTLESLAGKWIMLKVGGSECGKPCQDQLFTMRQLRTMQGKERDRVERVWLITDEQPLETVLLRVNDGTRMLRALGLNIKKFHMNEGHSAFLTLELAREFLRYLDTRAGRGVARRVHRPRPRPDGAPGAPAAFRAGRKDVYHRDRMQADPGKGMSFYLGKPDEAPMYVQVFAHGHHFKDKRGNVQPKPGGLFAIEGPHPTIGSWLHWGLGSLNDNLPSYCVLGTPLAVFLTTGSPSLVKRISPICLGEPRLNGCPARSCASFSSCIMRWPSSALCFARMGPSISTPLRSTR